MGRIFADLSVGGVTMLTGRVCVYGAPVNYPASLPFKGRLWFIDNEGTEDPTYDGLGTRFSLIYVPEGEDV
jgi:hypothetical protein